MLRYRIKCLCLWTLPQQASYDMKDVICSTAAPVSFSTPRGKFNVHCLSDRFVLESTTPKVGRCWLKPVEPRVESAWFQLLMIN